MPDLSWLHLRPIALLDLDKVQALYPDVSLRGKGQQITLSRIQSLLEKRLEAAGLEVDSNTLFDIKVLFVTVALHFESFCVDEDADEQRRKLDCIQRAFQDLAPDSD